MNTAPTKQGAKSRGCRQRGIATIELVIVAPFLLLLTFTFAELGRVLFQYNNLAQAVRDGARYYAMDSLGAGREATARNRITAAAGLLPADTLSIDFAIDADVSHGTMVRVTASYPFEFLPGNPVKGLLTLLGADSDLPETGFTVTATTTMRAQ